MMTEEQMDIINTEPTKEHALRVRAFAGTGKTTLLREYARARSGVRTTYVTFNRALKEAAEKEMPSSVRSSTVHSMAFRVVGRHYSDKTLLVNEIWLKTAARALGTQDYKTVFLALETLKSYLSSVDMEIGTGHVPVLVTLSGSNEKLLAKIVDMAKSVWDMAKSFKNRDIGMTHNGYLKMYQLKGVDEYRGLMLVDEAQDLTPCMWSVLDRQQARKVIVGDDYQTLYAWNGAGGVLSSINTVQELDKRLTRSFRFGQEIADVATQLLQVTRGEEGRLMGNPDLDTKLEVIGEQRGCPRGGMVLCRGNAEIFRSAVRTTEVGKIFIEGGTGGVGFSRISDIGHLLTGDRDFISDPFISTFGDIDELFAFAEAVNLPHIMGCCELVKRYREGIHDVINRVKAAVVSEGHADIRYSTVHKAKGKEWPVVCLARDMERIVTLAAGRGDTENVPELSDDFVNILYVALTRGTHRVLCPEILLEFAERGYEMLGKRKGVSCEV